MTSQLNLSACHKSRVLTSWVPVYVTSNQCVCSNLQLLSLDVSILPLVQEPVTCGQYLQSVCDQLSVLLPTVPVMWLRISSLAWAKIPATKCQNTILRVQSPVKSGQYQYLEYQYLSLEVTIFAKSSSYCHYRLIQITWVPVPVISGIYYCPEFQLLSREALTSHLSQSTFHLRSPYFQYMPIDISSVLVASGQH